MPDLNTSLHLDMLRASRRNRSLPRRLWRAVNQELSSKAVYGLEWGDPETVEPLRYVRDSWVLPYVRPDRTVLEIGPGGGRWTRYLLACRRLYVVDYHGELLAELKKNFSAPHMVFVQNNGTDFPGVPEAGIDFLFSFGTFVHLDPDLITAYLANIKSILRTGGDVVIQYADQTKVLAQHNPAFADTTPDVMRAMATEAGFQIVEEDLTTLWHSSLIRLTT